MLFLQILCLNIAFICTLAVYLAVLLGCFSRLVPNDHGSLSISYTILYFHKNSRTIGLLILTTDYRQREVTSLHCAAVTDDRNSYRRRFGLEHPC